MSISYKKRYVNRILCVRAAKEDTAPKGLMICTFGDEIHAKA